MSHMAHALIAVLLVSWSLAAQPAGSAPLTLPGVAVAKLAESLKAADVLKTSNLWRDVPPMDLALVHAYIEIPVGERNKFEFDIGRNALGLDRVIPESLGGWGTAEEAWTYVQTTHAFFRQCRIRPGPCEIARPY